jgi:type IV pilus assembly protein PilA
MHVNLEKENCMLSKLRQRLAREEGFTLIELLIVIVIIGILLAIAVPSYLGFRDRANKKAAAADVRAAVPSAEAYFSDNGSYAGMTVGNLTGIDSGLSLDPQVAGAGTTSGVELYPTAAGATSYCLQKTVGGFVASVTRGAAPLSGGVVQEGVACASGFGA